MKRCMIIALLLCVSCLISACSNMENQETTANPFFEEYGTPFNVPPFEKIKAEHYMPAFKEGMKKQKEEIQAIIDNGENPDFENMIVALDNTGIMLEDVASVFFNLTSSHTNEQMQEINREVSPLLSAHGDDISLNPELFARIKAVNDQKDELELNTSQAKLLEDSYKSFVRGGALLDEEQKKRFREINEELSVLGVKFGDNLLAETNGFKLIIEDEADLEGLPASVISAAAETAKSMEMEGKWVFTPHRSSMYPFLNYSAKRELREKLLNAYLMRCDNDNENDSKEALARMAALRVERAKLLGYETHADYVLEKCMAEGPQAVYDFLDKLWDPALRMAEKEAMDLQAMIDKEGGDFKLAPGDWRYYTEKLRKERYDLDEGTISSYFELESTVEGLFGLANKLFGITFTRIEGIPVYQEDVRAYEVKEADGTHIGILYQDFFARPSKQGGAWMSSFRKQSRRFGENIPPVITMNLNAAPPVGDAPVLLTYENVHTLFHEFGHTLHGLLSNCQYYSQSGTSVPRDFVELPSQIMENWVGEPEFLKTFARHYETGEIIPDDLLKKLKDSSLFDQGFATVEYLAASYLDMDWHTLTDSEPNDVDQFEKASMDKIGLISEIPPRYRSTYFSHIFDGGYSSGYYSYIWAEVLDSDAFEAFKEKGLYDQETANSFRENILSKGGSDDAMTLYRNFRGRDPEVEPLLKKRGLL